MFFFVEIWAILTLKGYIWRFSYKKSAFCCLFLVKKVINKDLEVKNV